MYITTEPQGSGLAFAYEENIERFLYHETFREKIAKLTTG